MNSGYPRTGVCAQKPYQFIILGDTEVKHVWTAIKMALRATNQEKEIDRWMPVQNDILKAYPQIKADPIEVPADGFKAKRVGKGGGKKT